jgi:hypothetical protein
LPQKSKMSPKLTVLDVKKVNKARAKPTFEAKPPEGEGTGGGRDCLDDKKGGMPTCSGLSSTVSCN